MPPAIEPGKDSDGTPTPYDAKGIFTGSVTVVDGTPIATYPGEPGSKMCDASPANLSDPLLKVWKKSSHNPIKAHSPQTTGPLGCTSAWKDPTSGKWTTTIQSNQVGIEQNANGPLRTTIWSSHRDFLDWRYTGTLTGCRACDECVQSCSDFYPAPGFPESANKFVF